MYSVPYGSAMKKPYPKCWIRYCINNNKYAAEASKVGDSTLMRMTTLTQCLIMFVKDDG